MNRLSKLKAYLIGAMDRASDGGVGWRNYVTSYLKDKEIVVLDPCNKPIKNALPENYVRGEINKLKEEGKFEELLKFKTIRTTDLRMVDLADFYIFHLDMDIHTCGSYEEFFLGNRQKKPCLVVCKQGKKEAPNWLFWCIPHLHIFNSFEELFTYLDSIDSGSHLDETGRWVFFDKEAI